MPLTSLDKRVGSIYQQHVRRAREAGQPIEYDVAGLRIFVREFLDGAQPRCIYCWKILYEANLSLDHTIPVSRGGRWAITNLTVTCEPCNCAKSVLTGEEFAALMALLRTLHPKAGHDILTRLRMAGRVHAQRKGRW